MAALEHERLSLVFPNRPDIIQGIQQTADTPERITLFNTITSFISDTYLSPDSEPSAKRRRIEAQENGGPGDGHGMMALQPPAAPTAQAAIAAAAAAAAAAAPTAAGTPLNKAGGSHPSPTSAAGSLLIDLANAAAKEVVLLEIKEISVSIPQRKKYDLCFTENYLYTKILGTTAPVQGMVYKWSEIEFVFYAPIPEKQQLQYNYILFPRNTALSSTKSWPTVDFEPLLFTVPNTAPKAGIVSGFAAQTAAQVSDSYTNLMDWAINSQLKSVGNTSVSIVSTDARVFSSAVRQPHRPSEPAVHVKAHRGSKDGFLFLLPNGILWGYKKPLLFIPLDRIVALSYTNVLQRTFNVEVEVDVSHAPAQDGQPKLQSQQWSEAEHGGNGEMKTEVIEFAMIDQEDYQRIDETYVRRHGLNNRSMAEGRRAKRQLRENAPKGGAGEANGVAVEGQEPGGEDDDMAELDRAEQLLEEDEEDEEEEDYDPGSDGESEGEGETSEEEDDDDEGGEGGEGGEGEAEGYDEDGMEEEGYVEDHE